MKPAKPSLKLLYVVVSCLIIVGCSSNDNDNDSGINAGETTTPVVDPSFTGSVTAELSGVQSVPAVATLASGTVEMQLDTTDGSLTGTIEHSVSDATSAHVHAGAIGQNGAPVVMMEATTNVLFSVPAGTVLSAEGVADFVAGNYYVNVHSASYPDGEIRAQLSNDAVVIPMQTTLEDIQASVFTPICSICHSGGGSELPGSMDLSTADSSYAALVGMVSVSVPELLRVAESDADNSFLLAKLEGRQTVGSSMPLGGAALSAETIAGIRAWIDAGAQR